MQHSTLGTAGMHYLSDQWAEAGVRPGDTLLLHSSVKRTVLTARKKGDRDLGVAAILDSFIDALGPEGTLVLPLFNFDFAAGKPFDIRVTPSHMGALTEEGRRRKGAVRTGHPIYSFCAIGRNAGRFEGVDNYSGYDADSPFAIVRALGGKIGVLDLEDQVSMTYYHHVEEMMRVDYRYPKVFSGDYTASDGRSSVRNYGLYVRDLARKVETHVNPAGELMWREGLYRGDRPGTGCGLRTIDADEMFHFVKDIIESGRAENILYRIGA